MQTTGTFDLANHSGTTVTHVAICEDLHQVPKIILERAPDVELLDLSGNQLTELPDWLPRLAKLEVVFLSHNKFTHVPEIIGKLPRLRMLGMRGNQIERVSPSALPPSLIWLTLTDNQIQELPHELGSLSGLRKLLLARNRLRVLPESIARAHSLELLRLSANQFEDFPSWLFELPTLAWLAVAGNPATRLPQPRLEASYHRGISWSQLTLRGELGRGASGITYSASIIGDGGVREDVAVKVFASRVSSDGDSHDEMAAALKAGRHPSIVSTRGFLTDHPEGRAGLVLDLVPSEFINLAAPPSFSSCTRDVYRNDASFSDRTILSYAADIASAAGHLHSLGIAHGDLYAHNTLVSPQSALVSDFGAACVYDESNALPRPAMERIEARAFGILLHELLERASADSDETLLGSLNDLADRCDAKDVMARPTFAQIERELRIYLSARSDRAT
jgi:hypothetical protein